MTVPIVLADPWIKFILLALLCLNRNRNTATVWLSTLSTSLKTYWTPPFSDSHVSIYCLNGTNTGAFLKGIAPGFFLVMHLCITLLYLAESVLFYNTGNWWGEYELDGCQA